MPATPLEKKSINSFAVPWSAEPTPSEIMYRAAGLVRTTGTVFRLPPPQDSLQQAFDLSHKGTKLSVGARALCKHYERKSGEQPHPFWILPKGTETDKSNQAKTVLLNVLHQSVWRNVHLLNADSLVYEARTSEGWGVRWTLSKDDTGDCVFRGFVEPQEDYKDFARWVAKEEKTEFAS